VSFFTDIFRLMGTPDLWHASLQYAALLLLPALGGVISERSGVVNIAMEGMMLTGAFFAVAVDLAAHNVWIAVLGAMLAGGLMALIHAVVSIRYRADQIVSGVAINIFAAGITVFLVNRIYGLSDVGQVPSSDALPNWHVPILGDIPFLGRVFFQQNIMVYVALILLVAIQIFLFRTRLGCASVPWASTRKPPTRRGSMSTPCAMARSSPVDCSLAWRALFSPSVSRTRLCRA